ncbi:MAG: aldehyde dehydrogenase family protein [Rubrivivax sp.]|nr:MAG: aldehyde dehydrogenase family protein [Rubrivivax sp.]
MNLADHPHLADSPTDWIDQLFASQLPTALALRTSTAAQRIDKLRRFSKALVARRQALYAAFALDFSKPPAEVESTELLPVIEEVRHATAHLRRWMKPVRVRATWLTLGTHSRIEAQPRGRCLILGPWNYPVNTVLCPLVSAIAAGNTVIVKPSELTPEVSRVVGELIAEVFAPDEVAVVQGGVPTAQHLLSLPFDHIFFTGSPAVGKTVMKAAAEHLSSVTLELGGQSPVVVDETADLQRAAEVVMWGKLINLGQSCVAPDHAHVHRSVRQAFVQACAEVVRARFGPDARQQQGSPDLARVINDRHTDRIAQLVSQATQVGATVALGGATDHAQRFVPPTLLTDLPPQAAILSEEIFGPVLPILDYDSLDEVIARINAQPKPLALYIWSQRVSTQRQLIEHTSSGGVCVNHCMLHYVHGGLPFGGVNNSGMGHSHGHFGFKAFSHERAVLKAGWTLPARFMFPPYTPFKLQLMRGLVEVLRRL